MSGAFNITHLEKSLLSDQKAIWTSPLHLQSQDKGWLRPFALGTLSLVAADKRIRRKFGNIPMAHSGSLSSFGLAALAGGGATFFLHGSATHDAHSRETGFLAGEAAVDGFLASEALKFAFQRPRPNAAQA